MLYGGRRGLVVAATGSTLSAARVEAASIPRSFGPRSYLTGKLDSVKLIILSRPQGAPLSPPSFPLSAVSIFHTFLIGDFGYGRIPSRTPIVRSSVVATKVRPPQKKLEWVTESATWLCCKLCRAPAGRSRLNWQAAAPFFSTALPPLLCATLHARRRCCGRVASLITLLADVVSSLLSRRALLRRSALAATAAFNRAIGSAVKVGGRRR